MMIQHSWLFIESASNEVLVKSSNNVWKLLFPTTASERFLSLGGEAECALSYSHWDHSGLQRRSCWTQLRKAVGRSQETAAFQFGCRETINTLAFRRGHFISSPVRRCTSKFVWSRRAISHRQIGLNLETWTWSPQSKPKAELRAEHRSTSLTINTRFSLKILHKWSQTSFQWHCRCMYFLFPFKDE